MKKTILIFVILLLAVPFAFSQRVIINETFENTGFNADSLPPNWVKFNEDPTGGPGRQWAVRDSGTNYIGTSALLTAKAYNSRRALTIPWSAGNPIADDWTITDTFTVQAGDSLIFMMLFGSPQGFQAYLDTMQVWMLYDQSPALSFMKIATLKSNDSAGVPISNNVWKEFKFSLSQFAGLTLCLGFRYYINTSVDGFWCNIDNVYVGNRASINVQQIGTNLPKHFALHQNYPNPFNPVTKVKFDLPKNTYMKLEVYDNLGKLVKVLYEGEQKAGYYETSFDGSGLPSGTYYYRLTAGTFVETKRMILVK